MIYGGSNFRIGLTAGASKQDAAKEGKRIRSAIMSGLDGFAELSKAIASRAETGVLKALDGRPIRLGNKTYAATNYLLQSCGAILCKAYGFCAVMSFYKRLNLTIDRWDLYMMNSNFPSTPTMLNKLPSYW